MDTYNLERKSIGRVFLFGVFQNMKKNKEKTPKKWRKKNTGSRSKYPFRSSLRQKPILNAAPQLRRENLWTWHHQNVSVETRFGTSVLPDRRGLLAPFESLFGSLWPVEKSVCPGWPLQWRSVPEICTPRVAATSQRSLPSLQKDDKNAKWQSGDRMHLETLYANVSVDFSRCN